LTLREKTEGWLSRHHVELDPSLDEQQLIDEHIIDLLVGYTEVDKDSTVLEIGAGVGNITEAMVDKAMLFYCIEKNPKFIPILRQRLKYHFNIEVMLADALEMEYPDHDILISNLPYSISEAFFQRILKLNFKKAVFIVPISFADKLTASKGDPTYTKLSKTSSIFYESQKHETIPSEAYLPEPNTSTCITTLKPKELRNKIELIEKSLFQQSDKILKNALREAIITTGIKDTKKTAVSMINAIGIDEIILNRPVSRLSLEEIQTIEESLKEVMN
jgi:16S rRNA (adenine1518-N6/adenine1519-N6)-dimethyltransferase